MAVEGGAWRYFEKEDDATLEKEIADFKRLAFEARPESRADPTGYRAYKATCKDEELVCLTALEEKLKGEALAMPRADLGPAGMRALAAALVVNTTITELDLEQNCLHAEGGLALSRVLEKNGRVRSLCIGRNRLGKQGGLALAAGLRNNASVERLEAPSNELEDAAGAALFAALEENRRLTRLNLAGNCIGDGAVRALAALLAHNATLTDAELRDNRFSSRAAHPIAKALEGNTTLVRVDLSGSDLGIDGSLAFGAMIARNQSLKELALSGTGVPLEGAVALAYALRSNRGLRRLDLSCNPLTREGRRALVGAHVRASSQCVLGLERTDATVARGRVAFDPERLTGLYRLRLEDPWERWVAHRLRERACTHKGETWRHATLNRRRFQLPALQDELPASGLLEVDYIATVGDPIYQRRIKLDLSLPEGYGIALKLMERCLTYMEESWHNSYLSGKPFMFAKQSGGWKVPGRGVLELDYIIHSEHEGLRFSREEPSGHYRLHLALPWERWVADQLRSRALADAGDSWSNETFNGKPFQFRPAWTVPDWGVLEFDYATSQAAPVLAVPYELDMARPWCQWIARRLIERVKALRGGESWADVTLDGAAVEYRDPRNPWRIPDRGLLRLRHVVREPEVVRKERRRFNLAVPSEAAELEGLIAEAEACADCRFQSVTIGRERVEASFDRRGVAGELRPVLEEARRRREAAALEERLLELEGAGGQGRKDGAVFEGDWVFLDPPELGPPVDDADFAVLLARLAALPDDHQAMGLVRAAAVDCFTAAQVEAMVAVPCLRSKMAAMGALLPRTRDLHTLLLHARDFPFPCEGAPSSRPSVSRPGPRTAVHSASPARSPRSPRGRANSKSPAASPRGSAPASFVRPFGRLVQEKRITGYD